MRLIMTDTVRNEQGFNYVINSTTFIIRYKLRDSDLYR